MCRAAAHRSPRVYCAAESTRGEGRNGGHTTRNDDEEVAGSGEGMGDVRAQTLRRTEVRLRPKFVSTLDTQMVRCARRNLSGPSRGGELTEIRCGKKCRMPDEFRSLKEC